MPTGMLQLTPEYHARVWGGQRLQASATPIGEAWIVYEENRIENGPYAGQTLAEAGARLRAALLGEQVVRQTGTRFPLLIKLLDCADWLSIQVHPNNEQAARLEGSGHFGKTEAWHILEAESGARLIAGLQPQTTPAALADAIRDGSILDWVEYHDVETGDSVFTPAGTLHAIGPGLLIYEVQQTSDITYRVFDWNRPASAGRTLHIEQSVAVTDARARGQIVPRPDLAEDDRATLVACPYFTLTLLTARDRAIDLDTGGQSFHALTVTEGRARIEGNGVTVTLGRFETAIIPADNGAYRVWPVDHCRALCSSVEPL